MHRLPEIELPKLVDYPRVIAQAESQGLISLYPNSGAFGFSSTMSTYTVGWLAFDFDPTIRPEARPLTVVVQGPQSLARLAVEAWKGLAAGDAWLMPKAHWAYELDFGSGAWLPDLLRRIGVDPAALISRHDGSALAFSMDESEAMAAMLEGLLTQLVGTDFQLVFPGHDVVCSVHHHRQLWWTSSRADIIAGLRTMAAPAADTR